MRKIMRILIVLVCVIGARASEFDRLGKAAFDAQGDPHAAIPLLVQQVKAWQPSDGKEGLAAADANLGSYLMRVGQEKEAEEFLAQAIALTPDDVRFRINHGMSLVRLGRVEEAIGEHLKAFYLEPGNAINLIDLCAAFLVDEEFSRGRPYCEKSARLSPNNVMAFTNLAMVYAELGFNEKAATAIRTAKAKSPESLMEADRQIDGGHLRATEAYAACLAGRVDEGENEFLSLMKERPRDPLPFALRGLERLRRGRYADAIADFDEAYAMDPMAMRFVLLRRADADQKAGHAALASEDRSRACSAGFTPACPKKKRKSG